MMRIMWLITPRYDNYDNIMTLLLRCGAVASWWEFTCHTIMRTRAPPPSVSPSWMSMVFTESSPGERQTWCLVRVVKTLGKFNNFGEYSTFPVETVVGRDRMKFISNCPYFQLFNYFYRILRPVTAVISFYRLLSLTKSCKRLKIEKTWGPRVNWALESVPSRAHSEFSALLCSFNSQEKFVQGRIWARSGPRASLEHYQLVHRKCGVSHLFTEHYSCPPF